MVPGAAWDTHRSVARVTPCARTAASTPSAMRSPSRLMSRSMAKATGSRSTAMLDTSAATLTSRSGAWPVPLLMSSSRPTVVPWAKAAMARTTAMPRMPTRRRTRSDGRCTRAASSGSSTSTRSAAVGVCPCGPSVPAAPVPVPSVPSVPLPSSPATAARGPGAPVVRARVVVRRRAVRRAHTLLLRRHIRLFLITYHQSPPGRWWHGPTCERGSRVRAGAEAHLPSPDARRAAPWAG